MAIYNGKKKYWAGCFLALSTSFKGVNASEVSYSESFEGSDDKTHLVEQNSKVLTTDQSQDYGFHHGLKPDYKARHLQRALTMAGYNIGKIDGLIGSQTKEAITEMTRKYPEHFEGILEDNFSEIYQIMRGVGPHNLLQSDERILLSMRAIEAGPRTDNDKRIMVTGEVILTNPNTDESFYILSVKENLFFGRWLNTSEVDLYKERGYEVFFPKFNSGGLNFKENNTSYQKASMPWNPYKGSAMPGLSGGTVYGLEWEFALFNTDFGKPGFGDAQGKNQSWIYMTSIDSKVMKGRDRIGMHVDGTTVDTQVNDGTAGCPAIHVEYASIFFEMLDSLSKDKNLRPNHVSVIAPKAFRYEVMVQHDNKFQLSELNYDL